jgi:hypothetical protein
VKLFSVRRVGFMKRFPLLCAILGITLANELQPALDTRFSVENATVMGKIQLPRFPLGENPPQRCFDFDSDLCQREADGDYDAVFPLYEQRYPTCGMTGWKKLGVLGAGHVSEVELRKTPCGLEVAMKSSPFDDHQQDYAFDCAILKMLMRYQDDPRCAGCFPKFVHYSNRSTVCYAERVVSVPIRVFLNHINANSTAGFQHVRKAFVEGLGALSVLQEAGVKHRDLTFRNMLIRLPSRDSKEYRVVILDFGSAASATLGGHSKGNPDLLGNHGKNDAHAYACSFIGYFYPKHQAWCKQRRLGAFVDVGRPGSFERFLADIVQANDDRHMTAPVNYDALLAAFANVTSL